MSLDCLVTLSDGRFWLILGNRPMTQISFQRHTQSENGGKQEMLLFLLHQGSQPTKHSPGSSSPSLASGERVEVGNPVGMWLAL